MAVLTMDFESQFYGGRHMITAILPDLPRSEDPRAFYPENKKFKVLWLLHGTFGDCTDWLRRTNVEVYACEKKLAVIMPSGMNSDYVNWSGFGVGFNMYDYLFEELMPMVYNWLPVSDRREDNYIAGLSMGGAGAMLYGLNRPEKFAAVGSLSCPLFNYENPDFTFPDIPTATHLAGFRPSRIANEEANAGGHEAFLRSKMNTWRKLSESRKMGVDLPNLYFCIGTNDFLYPSYQEFKAFAKQQGWDDIRFEEEPGLQHEWRFWDKYIERFIKLYVGEPQKSGLNF